MYPYTSGDLVRRPETYSADILCDAVGILLMDIVHGIAVLLINLRAQIQRDPIFLQKHHRPAHVGLFLYLHRDLPGLFFTDPFDLRNALRFFFRDSERIFSKTADDPRRQRRADAFYRSGTQISFHGEGVFRHFLSERFNLELPAVDRMRGISALSLYGRALADHRKSPHAGQLF